MVAADASDRSPTRYRLGRAMRLSRATDFQAVFAARVRRGVGPVLVYARPNDLGHMRLGLSVSRRVGGAVARNRTKRMIREAFRLMQHDLPTGYDVVVVARPLDERAGLAEYQKALSTALRSLHRRWSEPGPPPDPARETNP